MLISSLYYTSRIKKEKYDNYLRIAFLIQFSLISMILKYY